MLAENTVLIGRRAITRSYAKINLTLDVLSKRENGYHDIKMIMQTVSLFDLILVDKTHRGILFQQICRICLAMKKTSPIKRQTHFLKRQVFAAVQKS